MEYLGAGSRNSRTQPFQSSRDFHKLSVEGSLESARKRSADFRSILAGRLLRLLAVRKPSYSAIAETAAQKPPRRETSES